MSNETHQQDQRGAGDRSIRRGVVVSCMLALGVCVVFAPSAAHPLLYFGDRAELAHPFFQPPSIEHLFDIWATGSDRGYRPVSQSLQWLAASVSQKSTDSADGTIEFAPSILHSLSIALHAGSAILVFWLLRLLGGSLPAAAVGAALFTVHPLACEPVVWVTSLSILVAGFASLLALLLLVVALQRGHTTAGDSQTEDDRNTANLFRSPLFWIATAFYIVGILSDPIALAVPLIAICLAIGPLRMSTKGAMTNLALWLFVAVVGGLFISRSTTIATSQQMPVWSRPLVAADAVTFYLVKTVAPFGLSPDYGRSPLVAAETTWFHFAWAVPLAICGLLWIVRADRCVWACAALLVAALAPSLGLIPLSHQDVSTVADRFAYLALLAPALAVSIFLTRFTARWLLGLAAMIVVGAAVIAVRQQSFWHSDDVLQTHVLAIQPNSELVRYAAAQKLAHADDSERALDELEQAATLNPRRPAPQVVLGKALFNIERYEEAEQSFRTALDVVDRWPAAQHGLGLLALSRGEVEPAMAYFREAIVDDPENAELRRDLAEALRHQGSLDEAVEAYKMAIEQNPYDAQAFSGLALAQLALGQPEDAEANSQNAVKLSPQDPLVHERRGHVLRAEGKQQEAKQAFKQSLELDPARPTVHLAIGEMHFAEDEFDLAAQRFERVIGLEPLHAVAYLHLGRLYHRQNEIDDAIAHYRAAVRLDDGLVDAHAGLAAALADAENWGESVRYYNSAVRLAGNDPQLLNNFGFVLTQIDELEAAVSCFEAAIRIDPEFSKAQQNLEAVRSEIARREAVSGDAENAAAEGG